MENRFCFEIFSKFTLVNLSPSKLTKFSMLHYNYSTPTLPVSKMTFISKNLFIFAIYASSFGRLSVVADDPLLHYTPKELPAIKPRIVNGDMSSPTMRPFFAKAGYDEYYFTDEIMCGASIIWSDILVTAA